MFEKFKIDTSKFYIKRLDLSNLEEVYELQTIVCKHLNNINYFIESSKERLQKILGDEENLCVGIFNKQNELISYTDLLTNQFITPNYFANDIVSQYKKEDILLFRAAFVHPNARGNKFMSSSINFFKSYARQLNKKMIVTMVHPDNVPSNTAMLNSNFILANRLIVEHEGIKYWRNIMYIPLYPIKGKKALQKQVN